jgi:hypothetical protein
VWQLPTEGGQKALAFSSGFFAVRFLSGFFLRGNLGHSELGAGQYMGDASIMPPPTTTRNFPPFLLAITDKRLSLES